MDNKTPLSEEVLVSLARACIRQLEDEEANLVATIQCLEALRSCAITSDLKTLKQLLETHQELQTASQRIAAARSALRQRLAVALDVPEKQVTIRGFSQIAPPSYAERLTSLRRRLIPLVNQANSLGHSIVLLVQQSMNLMREVLECLTGQASNDGYSNAGNRVDRSSKPLLHYRC